MKISLLLPLLILLALGTSASGSRQAKTAGTIPQTQKALAQESKAQQSKKDDDVVRISVTLVQIDAVVTDQRGRHITDLKPEDFELLEDNRRQRITNFSYVNAQPAKSESAAPARPSPNAPGVPPSTPARLRPDQAHRTIALVVDDLGMSFESVASVRDSLKRF